MTIAIGIIIFCIWIGLAFGASGGFTDCFATPAAVRSTSCTSHFSSGGGGGGGFGGGGGGGK